MNRIQVTCALVILWFATTVFGGQVFVTNTADFGRGSLREALTRAQSPRLCSKPCEVVFNIVDPLPPGGYWTIAPSTSLPVITEDSVWIDGASQTTFSGDTNPAGPEIVLDGSLSQSRDAALTFRRSASCADWWNCWVWMLHNLGFTNWSSGAIAVEGSDPDNPMGSIHIVGNYIGVEADGVTPAGNRFGVSASNAWNVFLYENIISTNHRSLIASNVVYLGLSRNTIGMDAFRTEVLGNGDCGIRFHDVTASRVWDNRIAGHRVAIGLTGASSDHYFRENIMIGNLQGIDLAMDGPTANDVADLDSGPNGLQNYPELSVQGGMLIGTLDSTPNTWFRIEICLNDTGTRECQTLLPAFDIPTDSFGQGFFTYPMPAAAFVTATATRLTWGTYAGGSTSEFASPVTTP